MRPPGSWYSRLLVLVALVLLAMTTTSCAALNPEDESHFNPVAFVNDTDASVEIALCGDTCDDTYGFAPLDPGDEQPQQVSNEDLPTHFLVRRPRGPDVCLTITLTEPRDETMRVPLSAATPCGDLLTNG